MLATRRVIVAPGGSARAILPAPRFRPMPALERAPVALEHVTRKGSLHYNLAGLACETGVSVGAWLSDGDAVIEAALRYLKDRRKEQEREERKARRRHA
jgi:hypothetical protein